MNHNTIIQSKSGRLDANLNESLAAPDRHPGEARQPSDSKMQKETVNQPEETADAARHSGIQVIARSAAIMRALGANPQGLSLAAIAQIVDLPRSTVQRIINALEEERMVEAMGPGGGFRIGPALGQLINQAQTDITSLVAPYMAELAERVQETVCLSSLSQDKVYVIDRNIAERELRVVFPICIKAPALTCSAGRVLLARQSEQAVAKLLTGEQPRFTPRTLPLKQVRAQLTEIRATGFAAEHEEYIEGVCSFSVALDTYLGAYALTVVSPSPRAIRVDDFRQALFEVKARIEQAIGA